MELEMTELLKDKAYFQIQFSGFIYTEIGDPHLNVI